MLIVIGLDGGTLTLARPWMAQGKLPTLARLCEGGRWGSLRSTVPPATLPSWTTFMTGVNPGKHGIFDFTRREPGAYRVRFVNSTFRKTPTVWRLLSEADKRVAVLGMPGTYPPEPINGCMVSGFDVPVALRAERSFVHPAAWADEIMRLGGFTFADFQEFYVGGRWYRMALSRLLNGIAAKACLTRAILTKEPWDCIALVFGESDTVAHHFWHFYDQASPRYDGAAAVQFGDAIELVYRAIDTALAEILDAAPPETAVVVASDHGFGGAGAKALYLNRWLHEQGWLAFERSSSFGLPGMVKHGALRLVPPRWQAQLFRSFGGRIASGLESHARFAGIDWRRTRAFSEELNYFPSVWLNCTGRDPAGQITNGNYDRMCTELTDALMRWHDPETGARVIRRVWRRADVYAGPWIDLAPDVILDVAEDEGFSYSCLPSGGQPGPAFRHLDRTELRGGKRFGLSGSHRPDGMFVVAANGKVSPGQTTTTILDMAPTILTLCGVPVPEWMEGVSLARPDGRRSSAASRMAEPHEEPYNAAAERVLEERLRALGYIA